MKVELQCGDTITIPEGCKAIVKDGSVVFEKEEKEEAKTQDFKDGDVLTSLFDNKVVFIFKEDESKQKYNKNDYYVCHIYASSSIGYTIEVPTKDSLSFCGHKDEVRLATNKEKQFLFDEMKKQGLKWNAEEKRVEKIRWRSEKCENYYFLHSDLSISIMGDTYSSMDDEFWGTFNYFRTEKTSRRSCKACERSIAKVPRRNRRISDGH